MPRTAAALAWATWLAERVWPGDDDGAKRDRGFFAKRFAVVEDGLLAQLCRTSLEVRSRVRIDDETGTAAASGPWLEEHIPAESLLHGLVWGQRTTFAEPPEKLATPDGDEAGEAREATPTGERGRVDGSAEDAIGDVATMLASRPVLRFGGKATVGLGRAQVGLWP